MLAAQRRPGSYSTDNNDFYLGEDDNHENSPSYNSNQPEQVGSTLTAYSSNQPEQVGTTVTTTTATSQSR